MTRSVIFFEPPIIHKQKEIDMPKQVGGKPEGPEVTSETSSPDVEVVEVVTVEKARPKEPKEPADAQITMPGVEPPQEDAATKKTWGEVMIFTSLKMPLHKLGLGMDLAPMAEGADKTNPELLKVVELWIPHEAVFGGGVQEARRFIKEAVEQDKIPAGTYVIARRVSTIHCKVETIRRVETFEEGV